MTVEISIEFVYNSVLGGGGHSQGEGFTVLSDGRQAEAERKASAAFGSNGRNLDGLLACGRKKQKRYSDEEGEQPERDSKKTNNVWGIPIGENKP